MINRYFQRVGAALLFGFVLSSVAQAQCPDTLLWTNGKVWAYRAVECGKDDLGNCAKATDKVIYFDRELSTTGCEKKEDSCACRLEKAEYLFQSGNAPAGGFETDANQAVQNRGCTNIDSIVVKIGDAHYQCIEYRFVADPYSYGESGPVARNMRVSFKVNAKADEFVNDLIESEDAKMDGSKVVRKAGDSMVEYPLLKSGIQELPAIRVAPAPETTDPAQPPVPSGSGTRPGPDNEGSAMKGSDKKEMQGSEKKMEGSDKK